jgi:WD40 repeat protein
MCWRLRDGAFAYLRRVGRDTVPALGLDYPVLTEDGDSHGLKRSLEAVNRQERRGELLAAFDLAERRIAGFSPDGWLAATSSLDQTVRVWKAWTGQVLRGLWFSDGQRPLVFNSGGSQFAVADNRSRPRRRGHRARLGGYGVNRG